MAWKRLPILLLVSMSIISARSSAQQNEIDNHRELKMPSEIDGIVMADHGDQLLLRMNRLSKIAVFDVEKEKITGYIPMPGADALVAGLAEDVIIVSPSQKVIQKWSLDPLEKVLTVALPLTETVDGVAAGYASSAPILIMTRKGPEFLDPMQLKIVSMDPSDSSVNPQRFSLTRWRPHPSSPIVARASADGLTFAGWQLSSSPSGIRTLQIQGDQIVSKYEHESAGVLIPSANGTLLFTSTGVYNSDLQPLDRSRESRLPSMPTLSPAYYLKFSGDPFATGGKYDVSLFATNDHRLLFTFDPLPGLGIPSGLGRPTIQTSQSMMTTDRIIPHVALKKLLYLDISRSTLHIHPLDILAALNKKGIDYLFIESLPVTTAKKGEKYEYPIQVLSKAGNVTYGLDSVPDGMTVTPKGVLQWDVPQDFKPSRESVIISVSDGSTQSIYHSFVINVK